MSNRIIEGIKNRRSCRNFSDSQINESDLNEILECGLLAPSGMNKQGIELVVIQNKEVITQLKTMVGRNFVYNAPTLIVVCASLDYKYVYTDGSTVMENMYIASNALELGACWINQLKDFYGNEILKQLGLQDKIIVGTLALGYPLEKPEIREINKNRITYIK